MFLGRYGRDGALSLNLRESRRAHFKGLLDFAVPYGILVILFKTTSENQKPGEVQLLQPGKGRDEMIEDSTCRLGGELNHLLMVFLCSPEMRGRFYLRHDRPAPANMTRVGRGGRLSCWTYAPYRESGRMGFLLLS